MGGMRFLVVPADDRGATALEYGLIVAGVAVATLGAFMFLGDAVYNTLYGPASDAIVEALGFGG